ncbi:MAG: Crp/Fnr family transcriptional regulator [Dehalococcoidia bacterium]
MSTQTDTTALFKHADGGVAYAAGQAVFSEGEPGTTMYAVQSGSVTLLVNGVVVETVGPGGLLGELALIDNEPRTATAIAEVDSTLVPVDQARFMLMIRQTPFFAMDVMRLLARRLRQTDRLIHP